MEMISIQAFSTVCDEGLDRVNDRSDHRLIAPHTVSAPDFLPLETESTVPLMGVPVVVMIG
jgi:hypothetical protein